VRRVVRRIIPIAERTTSQTTSSRAERIVRF
jgi:hypothetical protein